MPGRRTVVCAALLAAAESGGAAAARRPRSQLNNGVRHAVAAASSGAIGVSALAPLEMIRINLVAGRQFNLGAALGQLEQGWFRGNGADALAAAARIGITLPMFAVYKRQLGALAARRDATGRRRSDGAPPTWAIFGAGALAGCTAAIATFPLDVVRTRLALGAGGSMLGTLSAIARAEGVGALYAGMGATLAGVVPFNAIKLAAYDLLRRRAGADDRASLPSNQVAVIGALSGIVAATSCYPLEVVRRRQMMGGSTLASLSLAGALVTMVRTDGAAVLWRGCGLNAIKVGLGNSLGFVLYELAKDLLEVDGRTSPLSRLRPIAMPPSCMPTWPRE